MHVLMCGNINVIINMHMAGSPIKTFANFESCITGINLD